MLLGILIKTFDAASNIVDEKYYNFSNCLPSGEYFSLQGKNSDLHYKHYS